MVCAGPYTWYQIDFRGTVGWIAEGFEGQYFAEPGCRGRAIPGLLAKHRYMKNLVLNALATWITARIPLVRQIRYSIQVAVFFVLQCLPNRIRARVFVSPLSYQARGCLS